LCEANQSQSRAPLTRVRVTCTPQHRRTTTTTTKRRKSERERERERGRTDTCPASSLVSCVVVVAAADGDDDGSVGDGVGDVSMKGVRAENEEGLWLVELSASSLQGCAAPVANAPTCCEVGEHAGQRACVRMLACPRSRSLAVRSGARRGSPWKKAVVGVGARAVARERAGSMRGFVVCSQRARWCVCVCASRWACVRWREGAEHTRESERARESVPLRSRLPTRVVVAGDGLRPHARPEECVCVYQDKRERERVSRHGREERQEEADYGRTRAHA
jgi:hypothetical protein